MVRTVRCLLACLVCALVQATPQPTHLLTTSDGRVADAYVPACVSADSPILVSFHGLGFKKSQQPMYDHYYMNAESECTVVVYPQGKVKAVSVFQFAGFSWNAGGCCPDSDMKGTDDVAYVDELVDIVVRDYGANGNLVFASGISNGAMMANRYGCASDRVKGVISVAGPLMNGTGGINGEAFSCPRAVPTLYFHGTHDPIVPYGGCSSNGSSFGHLCPELYKMGPGFSNPGIMDPMPSVPEFITQRKNLNGIDAADQGRVSFQNKSATCTSWGHDANNFTACKLEGMGHAWPARDNLCYLPWTTCDNDVDATKEAWHFMRNIRQRSQQAAVVV